MSVRLPIPTRWLLERPHEEVVRRAASFVAAVEKRLGLAHSDIEIGFTWGMDGSRLLEISLPARPTTVLDDLRTQVLVEEWAAVCGDELPVMDGAPIAVGTRELSDDDFAARMKAKRKP